MTSRNDPCPCNSGKKYKKCCLPKDQVSAQTVKPGGGPYSFVPGSYGGPGAYIPSIGCKDHGNADELAYHFVLVNPAEVFQDEYAACRSAELDLEVASQEKAAGGSDYDFALILKDAGYINVKDFRIIEEKEQKMDNQAL
ncbi:MAG: SEC-C domain-containing protein [Thioalkalivibrio sp.]|nr:SEC-C domain-containing protein [Thioalkalivibrio sp.]